jgi:NurA-like 5'-3' nuclease
MKNTNIGNNSGIIGDGNIIVFNMQSPLTKEQVEEAFLKLEIGDFQDITEEYDESLREKDISILSYTKNYWLQLKRQLIREDFDEPWVPNVPSDLPQREKKKFWKFTSIYQDIILPFSYLFISMDGDRYFIPLPKVEYNKVEEKIDKNNPVKNCTITKVQYQLGKVLTDGEYYNMSYSDMLKQCKIEVIN